MPCLDDCIFHKGGAGFGDFPDLQFGLRDEPVALPVHHGLDFPELGGIVAGENNLWGHLNSQAVFLAANNLLDALVGKLQQCCQFLTGKGLLFRGPLDFYE